MVKVLDTWKPRERSRQVVLDKPALEFGHTPKELKQIRSRMSYQHWKKMAAWVKSNPSSKEILKELHRSRDGGGYGSYYNSQASIEALELVCLEEGLT